MFSFKAEEFNVLKLEKRINLLESEDLMVSALQTENRILNRFYHDVILDNQQNSYVRKSLIQSFSKLVYLGQLKDRQLLSLFIDSWDENWVNSPNVFVEVQRLKGLLSFYIADSIETDDIESVYKAGLNASDAEILGECHYSLGIIYFQKALISDSTELFQDAITLCKQHLESANTVIENRVDATIIYKVVIALEALFKKKWAEASYEITTLANRLFQSEAFALNHDNDNLQYHFYRMLCSLQRIYNERPAEWLDFKFELDKLFINYHDITNLNIKNQSVKLLQKFSKNLNEHVFKPYVVSNISTEIKRIEVLQRDEAVGSDKHQFLETIKNLIMNGDKKKEDIADLKRQLTDLYPDTQLNLSDEELRSPNDIIKCISNLKEKHTSLLEVVLFASKKLQGDITFKRAGIDENARNRFIANIIEARGLSIKDQTQWSMSPAGKSSGEVDIFVTEKDGTPKSIIEALNLDSLKQDYLITHLNKIFTYDVTGLNENYIVTYSTATNFAGLWTKYLGFIRSHDFKYELNNLNEIERNMTDIRLACSKHEREGKEVLLFHVFINMFEPKSS